jgi:hypothetical protein
MNAGNTEVTIWASQMRPGGLPAVCVKTGAPADRWVRRKYSTAPQWTQVLLVLGVLVIGILPYIVVRAIVSVRATGQLPFAGAVATRLRLFSIGGILAFVASVVVFIAGIAANSGAVTVLGVLLFVVAIALLIAAGTISPRAVVSKDPAMPNDRIVVLRRVHPNFAAAVLADQQATAPRWPSTAT